MINLDDMQSKKLKDLCAEAYKHYDSGDFKAALRLFYQAWVILPKPQTDFQESGWVLTGIGDTYYRLGQFDQACEALNSALHCPGTETNPFVLLRLGQSHLDLGDRPNARKFLRKAHSRGGAELFAREASHYLNAISDLI